MNFMIEVMESRTLMSASDISNLQAEYQTVVADATSMKLAVAAAFTTSKANVKSITADIKSLPKSKANTAASSALKKSATAAGSLDVRDAAKVYSLGKADLNKARSAFLADVKKPTTANTNKMIAALIALSRVLATPEAKLASDVAAGSAGVFSSLNAIVAANPSDTQLATDSSTAQSAETSSIAVITADVSTLNADLTTLISSLV